MRNLYLISILHKVLIFHSGSFHNIFQSIMFQFWLKQFFYLFRLVSAYKDRILHPTLKDHLYKMRKFIKHNFSFNDTILTSVFLGSLFKTESGGTKYPKDLVIYKAPKKLQSVSERKKKKFTTKAKKTKTSHGGSKPKMTQFLNNQRLDLTNPKERGIIPTFPEFARYTIEMIFNCRGSIECLQNAEPHIAPASSWCPPCLMQLDFIFKVMLMRNIYCFLEYICIYLCIASSFRKAS